MELQEQLHKIIPNALEWAKAQAEHVALVGKPLPSNLQNFAQRVGVREAYRIRVKLVDQLPMPEDSLLKEVAISEGLLGPNMAGLTLGHSIFIVNGQDSLRLITHECRHVFQYELFGSIELFLPVYMQQIAIYGYANSPLEIDARAHEITA